MDKLTFTMENYLEAVYELSRGDGSARLTDIAARMDVTKSTANTAMSILAQKGLITNEKYQQIHLTDAGLKMAGVISEKHHIIQRFFTDILKIDYDTADTDACAIEHVISSKSVSAMHDFLRDFSKNGKI
jgi:Mn-dependent DtxR family transcriptional regulator